MKILYIAYRHDAHNPNAASGADYNFYNALRNNGCNVKLIGPFAGPPFLFERALKRLYKLHASKKYLKHDICLFCAWLAFFTVITGPCSEAM